MTVPTSYMRFHHCPFCGFDTQQYIQDYDGNGTPTGWVCLVDVKHVMAYLPDPI